MDSVPHIVNNNMFNQEKHVKIIISFLVQTYIFLITHRPVVVYMTGTPSVEIEWNFIY